MRQLPPVSVMLLLCAMAVCPNRAHSQVSTVCAVAAPSAPIVADSAPNLAGIWDFSIDLGTARSTGTMALGQMDDGYAGALTPDATNTVAIRKLTLRGDSVHMSVASREGDVLFDGRLANRHTLCGIVLYHGGKRYPMVATLRPRPNRG